MRKIAWKMAGILAEKMAEKMAEIAEMAKTNQNVLQKWQKTSDFGCGNGGGKEKNEKV